ncbi:hypothetical protein [Dyadobacter sp. NIV53]|uniref:hypothetical protein n=1 Tax=Dyadobacter sp. NIV53 TaxID=2861765 RepID=UPI001C869342|nr:hypothetical protein [Dyadobacter sp. NIV53]
MSDSAEYSSSEKYSLNDTFFEYTGKTGLTVTGSVTGRKYRFNNPGDKVIIHYKDMPGMLTIPVLKEVLEKETA